jgi:hypothetical protein
MSYLHFSIDGVYFEKRRKHQIIHRQKTGISKVERSMASLSPQFSTSSNVAGSGEARGGANRSLALVAEQELLGALAIWAQPSLMGCAPPTQAEAAALDSAVHAICREAHRLGLQAEELVIAIKEAWVQLTATRRTYLGERDGDILGEVVSSSIEVFFDSRE